jgi:hypothetical protein
LAASIQQQFHTEARIKPGKSGQFDVIADSKLIYSKSVTGRFPADGEVEKILARH